MTAAPTSNTDHSNLWHELAKRKQPTKLIDIPAFDEQGKPICKVLLRTLIHDDMIGIQKAASFECDRSFKDENVERQSAVYHERYNNIAAKHFLFRACRDPENVDRSFFPTPDHIGKVLSNDEVATLMIQYQTLQSERGPVLAYLTPDQQEEWINKLANAADEGPYFLSRLLPEARDQLMMSMAVQLWNYRTGKFSPGSLQENSTQSISQTQEQQPKQPTPQEIPRKQRSKKN